MGWEIRPEGLGLVLDMVHSYGRYPRIVVTEGGASFPDELIGNRVHDDRRIAYYESHLAQVQQAQERGVPVDGYFCWSLMDNFEWAAGFEPRFGLVYIDYENQQRIIKDSGHWFAGQLGGVAATG
jgi:beta-glucosidase